MKQLSACAREAATEGGGGGEEDGELVEALVRRGVTRSNLSAPWDALRLVAHFPAGRIRRQIRHHDYLCSIGQAPRTGGWLVNAIVRDTALPAGVLRRIRGPRQHAPPAEGSPPARAAPRMAPARASPATPPPTAVEGAPPAGNPGAPPDAVAPPIELLRKQLGHQAFEALRMRVIEGLAPEERWIYHDDPDTQLARSFINSKMLESHATENAET